MKLSTTFLIACVTVLSTAMAVAQAVGDYRSVGNGNWGAGATWERWNGSTWAVTANPPAGTETITIQSGDTVTMDVAVDITDTLVYQGELLNDANLTVGDGGVFQHDQDAGRIPSAAWESGSTLLMTGTTGVAPDNRNQAYHHIVFNTPGMLSNLNMDLDSVIIGGDIRIIDTGPARWYLTSALAGDTNTVWIMGDIIMEAGQFSSNGTGNACHLQIHHYGNTIVTGGNFAVSRGSQGSGTGSTRWYLYGDSFSMSDATTQNSNALNAWFIFAKDGEQELNLGSGNTLTAFPIVVDSGTTLKMGLSKLRGSGRFEVLGGAAMATGEPGGIDSAVVVTGNLHLDSAAAYIFNGTTGNQVTGLMLPDTVRMVVNENPDTLTLSQATYIFGPLVLRDGIFDNTIPFDLGTTGWIVFEGGDLLIGVVTSAEEGQSSVPGTFYVDQNYPNPFNPTTTINYGLPTAGFVSAKLYNLVGQEVATLFEGQQSAGVHQLNVDGTRLPSGVYLYKIESAGTRIVKTMVLLK